MPEPINLTRINLGHSQALRYKLKSALENLVVLIFRDRLITTVFPSQRHRPLGESFVLTRTYLIINQSQIIVLNTNIRAVARLVPNPRVEKQQGFYLFAC